MVFDYLMRSGVVPTTNVPFLLVLKRSTAAQKRTARRQQQCNPTRVEIALDFETFLDRVRILLATSQRDGRQSVRGEPIRVEATVGQPCVGREAAAEIARTARWRRPDCPPAA